MLSKKVILVLVVGLSLIFIYTQQDIQITGKTVVFASEITDLFNKGTTFIEYENVLNMTKTGFCTEVADNIQSGGFVVFIRCKDNNCNNDSRVVNWNNFRLNRTASNVLYFRSPYNLSSFRYAEFFPNVLFESEVDFKEIVHEEFTGKNFFIAFHNGAERVDNAKCTLFYNIQFAEQPLICDNIKTRACHIITNEIRTFDNNCLPNGWITDLTDCINRRGAVIASSGDITSKVCSLYGYCDYSSGQYGA